MKQQALAHPHRRGKGKLKPSTIAIYASAFILLVVMIAIGYRAPEETSGNANAIIPAQSAGEQSSVDNVVAASVAAEVAQSVNLPIASNVMELSISTQNKNELSQSDQSVVSKPQIVQLTAATRAIVTYTAVAGDTVQSVAAKYNVSAETIKWANNLTSDAIAAGKALDILPVNGVVYTAKAGDSVQSIADKYKADASRITAYNDLENGGLNAGLKIIIPGGTLPDTERPGYVAPVAATTAFLTGYSSGFGGGRTWFIHAGTPNGGNYAYGNCTAYAYDRRVELGLAVGKNWGNAGSWAYNAANGLGVPQKLQVDHTPSAGAVIQDSGHVAIVEEVLENGDLSISEMNAYVAGGGWNVVSGRILPAAYVGQYLYIH